MTPRAKKTGGRPVAGLEPVRRYLVSLEPRIAERLREYGGGNLSGGIARAAELRAVKARR